MDTLRLATGIVALSVMALFFGFVLWRIYRGTINLEFLIGDANGDASMSRFQLLIFTFVVALSFLYLVFSGTDHLPEVPASVLTLLGISGTSYLVSKSIDK